MFPGGIDTGFPEFSLAPVAFFRAQDLTKKVFGKMRLLRMLEPPAPPETSHDKLENHWNFEKEMIADLKIQMMVELSCVSYPKNNLRFLPFFVLETLWNHLFSRHSSISLESEDLNLPPKPALFQAYFQGVALGEPEE